MADIVEKLSQRSSNKQRRSSKGKRFESRSPWNNEKKEIKEIEERYQEIDIESISKFSDFPLSKRTLEGITYVGYMNPTEIQKQGIAAALRGCDVLGAAKTGSGKTLAFLIPVIEALWRQKWTSLDGLGALIISPTRELAYQTFEVIVKIGCKHDLSAGLVIGGKNLKEEQVRINKTNIVVCTPGRLLQHMDETPNFDCSSLQILVLDEADRILDLGFAATLNSIIENLPTERQTLLFSATQTKSVKDLARLSLQNPEYIAVHEHSTSSTPQRLKQSYVVCDLPEKLNFLYSFVRNHLKSKILVFASSCKQVKYIYEVFRRLQPGIPLMALYGKQKQLKRVGIYDEFCRRTNCVLFATDIAARGLDFPAVNWVIQLDCPEDANTYIHRAGRTARYQKDGQSLLVLLPSEELEMLKALEEKKVPISAIRVNPKKLTNIQSKLEAFCAQDQEIKHWAQKSVVSYVRSVFLQSNKKIFDAQKLPVEAYAKCVGLPNAPRIRFMKKAEKMFGSQSSSNSSSRNESSLDIDVGGSDDSDDEGDDNDDITYDDRPGTAFSGIGVTTDQDDSVLFIKRRNVEVEPMTPDEEKSTESAKKKQPIASKIHQVKKLVNKKIKLNTKILFDEDGEVIEDSNDAPTVHDHVCREEDITSVPLSQEKTLNVGGISVEEARRLLQLKDKKDRERERKRIRDEHKKKKRKGKEKKQQEQMGVEVQLGGDEEDEIEKQDTEQQPKSKKRRKSSKSESSEDKVDNKQSSLMEDEELALHLLHERL